MAYDFSPIQELVEVFDSEHQCQCFLLQLRVVHLTLCECAQGVGDWVVFSASRNERSSVMFVGAL